MTQEEWGPWIEHDGRGCPADVCPGVYIAVVIRFASGREERSEGRIKNVPYSLWEKSLVCWTGGTEDYAPIIRYRIRRPRGLILLQRITERPDRERI